MGGPFGIFGIRGVFNRSVGSSRWGGRIHQGTVEPIAISPFPNEQSVADHDGANPNADQTDACSVHGFDPSRHVQQRSVRSCKSDASMAFLFAAMLQSLAWLNELVEAQLRAWRWGRPMRTLGVMAFVFVSGTIGSDSFAADVDVRFDVPALAEASVADNSNHHDDALMVVDLLIPVTSEIGAADRRNIHEFRYDVRWQQARYPVVDFGPRTRTTSPIAGTIEVKTQQERNISLGLTLNGIDPPGLAGTATAGAGTSKGESNKYQEIPQHDVLVASGTLDRGTGVFFRFHRSKQETLEGSRTLNVSFRVPSDWQAGLLEVKCRASGERKVAGIWKEPIEILRSFTMPVYLSSSVEARDRAVEYVRAEQGFKKLMPDSRAVTHTRRPTQFEKSLHELLGFADKNTEDELQSRVVRYRVPTSAADASGRYKNAREELLQLSR